MDNGNAIGRLVQFPDLVDVDLRAGHAEPRRFRPG